jgi:acetoin utilization deacetylase AcuC-like enzyme
MYVVASDQHHRHAPLAEIESSGLQPPFEHPGRADEIRRVLDADGGFTIIEPSSFGRGPIDAVHDPGLASFLERAWREYQVRHPGTHDVVPDVFAVAKLVDGIGDFPATSPVDLELGRWCYETTTPITEGTYDAARAAVDIALSAGAAVLDGARAAYGLCRPPGHHAPTGLYGGYCFFNNAAILANHLVVATGSKVSVLDVDFHHGNGTQQIFYRRDDVQYVSLHGDPRRAYPYITGFAEETGAGAGIGSTLNVPLAAGIDDDAYLLRLADALDAISAFGAELVVVSLGVDTYHNDPISDLAITTEGFGAQGELIGRLGLPTVVVQEGGYDVDAIGANVATFLHGLGAPASPQR